MPARTQPVTNFSTPQDFADAITFALEHSRLWPAPEAQHFSGVDLVVAELRLNLEATDAAREAYAAQVKFLFAQHGLGDAVFNEKRIIDHETVEQKLLFGIEHIREAGVEKLVALQRAAMQPPAQHYKVETDYDKIEGYGR